MAKTFPGLQLDSQEKSRAKPWRAAFFSAEKFRV
jgi:hypothetical protein